MNIDLTDEEIDVILIHLDTDICAEKGCLDYEADGCESCKITRVVAQLRKKLGERS